MPAMRRAPLVGFVLAIAVLSADITVADNSIEISPPTPRALEPVYLRMAVDDGDYYSLKVIRARTTMDGNLITVTYDIDYADDLLWRRSYIELGRFPEGHYQVLVKHPIDFHNRSAGSVERDVGTIETESWLQFSVSSPRSAGMSNEFVPLVDYSGLWWNPRQPGWGLSVLQLPDGHLFAVWFDYDDYGQPVWYTLQPGYWKFDFYFPEFVGPVYRTSTPPRLGDLVSRDDVTETYVGVGGLMFGGPGGGSFRVRFLPNDELFRSDIKRFPLDVQDPYP